MKSAKAIKIIIGLLLVGSCIAFGVLLPNAVFSAEDKKIMSAMETYSVEDAQFSYNSTLFDVLECIRYQDYDMEYDKKYAQLTDEEVEEIAKDFIGRLDVTELDYKAINLDDVRVRSATPSLVIMGMQSSDAVDTAVYDVETMEKIEKTKSPPQYDKRIASVVWHVGLEAENDGEIQYIEMIIDDRNKKVVCFNMCQDESNREVASQMDETELIDFSSKYVEGTLIPFIEEYYETKAQAYYDGDGMYVVFLLDEEEGRKVEIHVSALWGITINY